MMYLMSSLMCFTTLGGMAKARQGQCGAYGLVCGILPTIKSNKKGGGGKDCFFVKRGNL